MSEGTEAGGSRALPAPLDDDLPAQDDDPVAVGTDPAYVLPRLIARRAATDPGRPFLVEVDGRALTYAETWDLARRWAHRLAGLGVGRGDRVLTLVPTSIDAVCLWLGVACLGAVEVPVNPELRGTFLAHALGLPRARLCLTRPEFTDSVTALDVPDLEVVTVERGAAEVSAEPPAEIDSLPTPADPACVIYTSGTTGPAKGVVIPWAQLASTIGRIPRSLLGPDDAVYCCHPMFHVTGRSPLLSMADVGGRVVLRERFSASAFLDDVRRHGCTSTTPFVPMLLATPERPDDADNPLRMVLSAAGSLARRFEQRFGLRVIECYGSTEAGFPLLQRRAPADPSRRWIGRPRRGYEARVADPEGHPTPDGEIGELWVRAGDRRLLQLGYLHDPKATAAAFHGDWYRTGDAVIRDPGGAFVFVDRVRDTIRRHGENISASALEAVVDVDPAVAACAVLGRPDPVAGQEVVLVVVPNDPAAFAPAELWTRLAEQVPRYMLPGRVVSVDSLPTTPTNKIRKVGLLDGLDLDAAWGPTKRHVA